MLDWEGATVALNYIVEEPLPPPPPPPFKEQLEGKWTITKGALSHGPILQDFMDLINNANWWGAVDLWGNRLQFESSGKVVLIYWLEYDWIFPPGQGRGWLMTPLI